MFNGLYLDTKDSINGVHFHIRVCLRKSSTKSYFAYDFNLIVNEALVRELEGTACAYRCWGRF